jgi:hypothetical protein
MRFIKGDLISEDRMEVTFTHYFPDMLTQEEKKDGYIIEDFANPERIEGKRPKMFFNPITWQVFFEYEDSLPETPAVDQTEEINRLKNQVSLIQQALDDMLLNGGVL